MSGDDFLEINDLIREDSASALNDDDDEGTETLTAAEVYARLETAWMNEKLSPELLAHSTDVVECMMEQLSVMQQNLMSRAHRNDLRTSIHRMEMERIRYILSDYYRIRLQKIECNAASIVYNSSVNQTDSAPTTPLDSAPTGSLASHCTQQELAYAREYQASIDTHLHGVALRHMPSNLQAVQGGGRTQSGALDGHVFMRVVKDVEGAVVEEETEEAREEVMDMRVGDQHIMRYRVIKGLVQSGDVVLV